MFLNQHLVMDEQQLALDHGFAAVKTAVAIVPGGVVVFELPHAGLSRNEHVPKYKFPLDITNKCSYNGNKKDRTYIRI